MNDQKSVRIVSDGTGWGTEIIDEQSGETLKTVGNATIEVEPGKPVIARMQVFFTKTDIKAQAVYDLYGIGLMSEDVAELLMLRILREMEKRPHEEIVQAILEGMRGRVIFGDE